MKTIKQTIWMTIFIAMMIAVTAARAADGAKPEYPFLDTSLPIAERVADIVSRLTLEEKVSLMNEQAEAAPRLGIKKYRYWNEALHGVMGRVGTFTIFPQAVGVAATWDPALIEQVGTAISDEAWGAVNGETPEKGYPGEWLLTFWSPTINMARDPRWGRTPETYGEDPFLTGRIALGFVRGLQGYDKKYIKVVSTPKHFAANNREVDRLSGNSQVSEKTLRDYYFQAFRTTVVEGNAQSVMGAYNRLNGIPCNANKWLLTDVLRGEWGFDGFIVTDCGAPSHMIYQHKYAEDGAEAAAFSVNAGVDIECGSERILPKYLMEALNRGLITEKKIDEAITHIMIGRMRLGMFDPPEMNPYTMISPSVIGSEKHRELTRQVSRESITLIKNDAAAEGAKLLPLDISKVKKIAVVGPYSDFLEFGDYSGKPANEPATLLAGLKARAATDNIEVIHIPWTPMPEEPAFNIVPENVFISGAKAEFFDNPDFAGAPAFTREDKSIYYTKDDVPESAGIGKRPYSVRWTARIKPELCGKHFLSLNTRGASKLYVNGELAAEYSGAPRKELIKPTSGQGLNMDRMFKEKPELFAALVFMTHAQTYDIVFEYVPAKGQPLAKLEWVAPDDITAEASREEIHAVMHSDLVIAAMGYYREHEREGMDRQTFDLPVGQEEYVLALLKMNPNVVTMLTSGSPIAAIRLIERSPAIVQWWYPGEQGGAAAADVLFGDFNPAGRLPFTTYKSTDDLPPFDDYEISHGATYMYFEGEPLYPFGHGISYTVFEYSDLKVEVSGGEVKAGFKVKNAGSRAGDEVAQLYVSDVNRTPGKPIKRLRGFKRVSIPAGETKEISLTFKVGDLAYWNTEKREFAVDPGKYELTIGASSADIRLGKTIKIE